MVDERLLETYDVHKLSVCFCHTHKPDCSLDSTMKQAFHGEVYDTANALLLARHDLPSGIEALRGQRVFDLYRTPSGSYFKYETTASLFFEEKDPEIIPISEEEAQSPYEDLDDRRCQLQDAFSAACLGIR